MAAALILLSLISTAQHKAIPVSNQPGSGLSEGARLLFGQTYSKLTAAQKNALYYKLGLQLSQDKKGFQMDGYDVGAKAYPVDMNKDAVEEVFVVMDGVLFGNTGQGVALFIKNSDQLYEQQAEVAGGIAVILDTKKNGYPELVIAGPGFEFPRYRWNGKHYIYSGVISDDDLQNANTSSVEDYSKLYRKDRE
jgi:hypothetical protein